MIVFTLFPSLLISVVAFVAVLTSLNSHQTLFGSRPPLLVIELSTNTTVEAGMPAIPDPDPIVIESPAIINETNIIAETGCFNNITSNDVGIQWITCPAGYGISAMSGAVATCSEIPVNDACNLTDVPSAVCAGGVATGYMAVAIGTGANASAPSSVALRGTASGKSSVTVGRNAVASGEHAVSIGKTLAQGKYAVSVSPNSCPAVGDESICISGHSTNGATGLHSLAIGGADHEARGENAVSLTGMGGVVCAGKDSICAGGTVPLGTTPSEEAYFVFGGDFSAVSFTTVSDARVKENILPAGDSLTRVMQLQAVAYNYDERYLAGGRSSKGFLAQEVRALFPEAVIVRDTTTHLGDGLDIPDLHTLKDGTLFAHLFRALQQVALEFRERVTALENRK